ncbi:MAG: CBS domain-containing protein [Candidatus Methylomirabilales bacterium]
MKTVAQLLRLKGGQVWSIGPDAMVYQALSLMAEKDVGALVVLQGERLVGILSERDYARKVILRGKSSLKTPVREIMTDRVVCVRPEQSVEECMALMTEHRVRHLPVLVDGRLAGVVSIGDVVKASIDEKDFMIQQLEHYITGSR